MELYFGEENMYKNIVNTDDGTDEGTNGEGDGPAD